MFQEKIQTLCVKNMINHFSEVPRFMLMANFITEEWIHLPNEFQIELLVIV